MNDDLDFQESLDRYFEIEAAELLQTIEQTLLSLVEEKTIERVHTLMRSAHTIKGGAANCGFKTIETIAHHLEDVFQALYPAELEIDPELGSLLMEGYDCLYDPLSAMLSGVPYDEAATLERTAELFARLQAHLGDFFGRETPLPTAAELGFDVVGSIFADSIPQDLEVLAEALTGQNVDLVRKSLTSLAEFLLELGGSYSLPGIVTIASTTLTALDRHPGQVLAIAQVALTNFQQAQMSVLGGDRSIGGEVSEDLRVWATTESGAEEFEEFEDFGQATFGSESADWLSLVDDNVTSTTVAIEADLSANWLSMVDDYTDSTTPLTEADMSADWLSMIDHPQTEPSLEIEIQIDSVVEIPATQSISDKEMSADWLSMVDHNSESTTQFTEDLSADWLSLVDTERLGSTTEETIEISSFEPESGALIVENSGSRSTEYQLEAIELISESSLVLSQISGIDRIFGSIASGQPDELKPEAQSAPAAPVDVAANAVTVRVATIQLERLGHTIGELLIDDNQQFLRAEQLQKLAHSTVEQYRRCEQRLRVLADWSDNYHLGNNRSNRKTTQQNTPSSQRKQPASNEVQSQFDSLELDVYSDLSILLQNMTDDLTELGLRVESLGEMTRKSRVILGKRKQLLADAQTELFAARMVEISSVLNRFPRLLQQMVASHRKPAELKLIGTTVSIDKIIAEKLYDPLLHLIRNAYDHGVESSESRLAQGKPATGQLTIKAYHQGDRTTIEVSDDGQGLNWVKIRQRAIDLHLLVASQADTATEAQLAEIMFAPGFSTADQVNDLSGRGIGLDVVRDRLSTLQGSIDVRSIAGKGTTFTMQFPLNLTTARLLICESQGVAHALRSEAISQVLLPSADQIQTQSSLMEKGTTKFLRWGEGNSQKLIPIYPLNDLLEYHCPMVASGHDALSIFPTQTKNSSNALLLLDIDDQQICLEVNRILVEQELVVKSLGQTFGLPNYIQGYSVLGDGSLTLALDPVELLAQVRTTNSAPKFSPTKLAALQPAIQAALAPGEDLTTAETSVEPPTESVVTVTKQLQVLVVDDSLVQRQSLVRSLTKAGCQVIEASHGREGLLRLQEHPRIRLVVCDIEMPQMNGFEFLSHCRQDARLSQIPIVMLTTRGGQKHRQLAMTLGAKDYLTKPQSERDLLDIISKLGEPVGV